MDDKDYIRLLETEVSHLTREIEELKNGKKDLNPDEYPKKLGTIALNKLYSLIRRDTGCKDVFLSDNVYNTTSIQEAMRFIKREVELSRDDYMSEAFDCDNFTIALKNYWNGPNMHFPLGIAWSHKHAFNIFVDNDEKIWFIEPQSSMMYDIKDVRNNDLYWPLRFVLI